MKHLIKDIYPINAIQKSMLFHSKDNSDNYAVRIALEIEGDVDVEKLKESFKIVVDRHDSLRTIFPQGNYNKMMQVVLKKMDIELKIVRSDCFIEIDQDKYWENNLHFNLEMGPLIQGCLFLSADSKHILEFVFHHIVIDGWSLNIFLQGLFGAYSGLDLKEPPQYKNYVKWIQKKQLSDGKAFYDDYLGDYLDDVKLESPINTTKEICTKRFTLDNDIVQPVIEKSKSKAITLGTLFQTVWGLTLNKLYNRRDIVFGNVVSGRNIPIDNVGEIIGLFINTLPVRMRYEYNDTFSQALSTMQYNSSKALDYESYPLERIIQDHPLSNNLFNHIIGVENYDLDLSLLTKGSDLKIVDLKSKEQSHFPLNLAIYPGEKIDLLFTWHSNMYTQEQIEQFFLTMRSIFTQVANNFDIPLNQIQIMDDHSIKKIVYDFNKTDYLAPVETSFSDFVNRIFQEAKDFEVVTDGHVRWTYRELEVRSKKIANAIHRLGCKNNDIIAIYNKRDINIYPMIFGSALAGCGFLIFDPELPIDRLSEMYSDCNPQLLLTSGDLAVTFETDTKKIMKVNSLFYGKETEIAKPIRMDDHDSTYVIYTSGTTGKPKGVALKSIATVKMADYFGSYMGCAKPTSLSLSPLSFDMFICDVFYTFAKKGNMVLVNEDDRKNNLIISSYIESEGVDALLITPSRLSSLFVTNENALKNLKTIAVGGEAISDNLVIEVSTKTNANLYNGYGPSETTAYNTMLQMTETTKDFLGRPAADSLIYILNDDGNPMPINAIGEICISGSQVGKGYINRPEMTKQKFVENPFVKNLYMYKTGDLGKWFNNGYLVFLGRKDDQIKIRGLRIETKEIEKAILSIAGISNAVVYAHLNESNEKDLVCVYSGTELDNKLIRDQLSGNLPEYMIPRYMIFDTCIKTTRTGKLDKAFYSNQVQSMSQVALGQLPSTEIQNKLHDIWSQVLNHKSFDVNSSFFTVGGNSLNAIILCAKLKDQFELAFTLKELFEHNTITSQEQYLLSGKVNDHIKLKKHPFKECYELTSTEQRIFAVCEALDQDSKMYNLIDVVDITNYHLNDIESALNDIVNRNNGLRFNFDYTDNGELRKTIRKKDHVIVTKYVIDCIDEKSLKPYIKSFDLSKGKLYDFMIFTSDHKKVLVMNFHHIIVDGSSINIIKNDLSSILNHKKDQRIRFELSDYTEYQIEFRQSSDYKIVEDKWKELLTDFSVTNDVHSDLNNSYSKSISFNLSEQSTKAFRQLANRLDVTLYQLSITLFGLLRARATNSDDYMVGTLTSGRNVLGCEDVIGMLVNTIPVRIKFNNIMSLKEFIIKQKEFLISAIMNDSYPLNEIVKIVNENQATDLKNVFNELFILQEFDSNSSIKTLHYNLHVDDSKFPLIIEADSTQNSINYLVNFDSSIYSEQFVKRMMGSYFMMIDKLENYLNSPVDQLPFVTDEEYLKLSSFEGAISKTSLDTIQALLNDVMVKRKSSVAIVDSLSSLSYSQLMDMSKSLASYISACNIHKKLAVAIMVRRTKYIPIATLAALFAGSPFILIDPDLPTDRINYMLKNAKVSLLMTDDLSGKDFDINILNVVRFDYLAKYENRDVLYRPDDIAYLIYTSGTTGEPKGVINTNRGLLNSTKNIVQYANDCDDMGSVLSVTSVSFDMFVIELFMSLCSGRTFVIANEDERMDNNRLAELIESNSIKLSWMTPSRMSGFISEKKQIEAIKGLNGIFLGGEALSKDLFESLINTTDATIYNMYGPSETAVFSCGKKLSVNDRTITLGRPSQGNKMYILGDSNQRLPIGEKGEIAIGGVGVGFGYLGNVEQTNKSFIDDPYHEGYRLYKTGDLGMWTESGEILYHGRKDNQVKIRGCRIEIEEIEKKLKRFPGIRDVVVTIKTNDNQSKYLVAYLVGQYDQEQLILELRKSLPYYMIPELFVAIDAVPLTPAGKINYKELNTIEIKREVRENSPKNEMEIIICDMFKEVLNISDIDVYDNFYHIGGDSIKAIQLVGAIRAKGFKLSVKDIVSLKTPKSIAQVLMNADEIKESTTSQHTGNFKPIPIAKEYLRNNDVDSLFNQSVIYKTSIKDIETYRQLISSIIDHHDALRSIIIEQNQSSMYRILPQNDIRFSLLEFNSNDRDIEHDIKKHSNLVQQLVKPSDGVMLSSAVFHTETGDYLLVCISHLVVDGISWNIISEDINSAMSSIKQDIDINLGIKSNSVIDYSKSLSDSLNKNTFESEKAYWNLRSIHQSKDADNKMGQLKMVTHKFSENDTFNIKNNMLTSSMDINSVILASYAEALSELENLDQVNIFFESHGRSEDLNNLDLTRSVGWFTSVYPLVFRKRDEFTKLLRETQYELKKVPNYGVAYGALANEENSMIKETYRAKNKKFYNYLGEIGQGSSNFVSEFQLVDFYKGQEIGNHVDLSIGISMNVVILNNSLSTTYAYDKLLYSDEDIDRIHVNVQNRLNKNNGQLKTTNFEMPETVGNYDLGIDELDNILDIVDGLE